MSKITYDGIFGFYKELGYTNITMLHYRVPLKALRTGLRCLSDDMAAGKALEECIDHGSIEVYSEHDENVENSDLNVYNDLGDANDIDYVYEEEKDSELESDAASIGDESDEEVIEVRQKRKYSKKKSNEPIEEIQVDEARAEVQVDPINTNPSDIVSHEVDEVTNQVNMSGYESEYPNSSDYDSPLTEEDSDGDFVVQKVDKRITYPVYDPKNMFKQDPELGLRFAQVKDCKNLVTAYAVRSGYNVRFKRSCKKDLGAKCTTGCPWRIWCSKMQNEESFQIKTMVCKHTCIRNYQVKIVNARFLSQLYQNKILANPRLKLREIKNDVIERYGLRVSLVQCYRLKKMALGEVDNILKEHYSKLWDYAGELDRSNPDSTIIILPDNGVFLRMYVCFGAVKNGWISGCRPVIGVDGAFLKGFCKGELLTAVGRDGNNQMYPIAWAIVSDGETKESWKWFLSLLMNDLNIIEGAGVTIISDQQKGLEIAVAELLPRAEHRNCARHIYANFRKPYGGAKLKLLFWQACKTGTRQEFENLMIEIEETASGASQHIRDRGPQHFARAFFSTWPKCEAVENNMCECLNGVLIEARAKSIINMLEDIRLYIMERIVKKRELFNTWSERGDTLCPRIRDRLEKNKDDFRKWTCTHNGDKKFELKHISNKFGYVVNLRSNTCTCRLWELSGIPCSHAVAAIYFINDNPDNYVADWYKLDFAKKAYQHYIQPMNGERLWERRGLEPLQPPLQRRMPGRPKKQRRREHHEKDKGTRVSRVGTTIKCGKCKQPGHNKTTCTATVVSVQLKFIVNSQFFHCNHFLLLHIGCTTTCTKD